MYPTYKYQQPYGFHLSKDDVKGIQALYGIGTTLTINMGCSLEDVCMGDGCVVVLRQPGLPWRAYWQAINIIFYYQMYAHIFSLRPIDPWQSLIYLGFLSVGRDLAIDREQIYFVV